MIYFKKFVFAIPFLLFLTATSLNIPQFLNNPYLFLSFDISDLLKVITLVVLILLTSLMFVIFASLANDWKLILPVSLLSALPIILIVQGSPSYLLSIGLIISLGLTYAVLYFKLKSYLTFSASAILGPSAKHLSLLFLALLSVAYFLTTSSNIGDKFHIPDTLLNPIIKIASPTQDLTLDNSPSLPSIDPTQIAFLKSNPQLLKQYNIDPKVLDTLTQPSMSKKELNPVNELVKSQLQEMIKPYTQFIAPVLGLLFFLTLLSMSSLLSILVAPLLWLIFYLLEVSGFVMFEKEMREVKKLVI